MIATVTFDSSYPAGGEALTAAQLAIGGRLLAVLAESVSGLSFEYDRTNSKLKAFGQVASAVTVTDLDAAASTGVAVYLHTDEILEDGSILGHLEFVSPTNADGIGTVRNGGATYIIRDDDAAATGGLAVYFDEDAAIVDERFVAVVAQNRNAYILLSDGSFLKIKDLDTAATAGVQVYFDEDATNSYERLLFVSPTDVDGVGSTDDELSLRGSQEVVAGADLSGVAVKVLAIGD
jgi:hypothetical protein